MTGKAHIKWKIVETATGKVVSEGEKDPKPEDFNSENVSSEAGSLVKQTLPLGNHFSVGLGQSAGGSGVVGFGLIFDRDDEHLFSWDWFDVDRAGHATKLQESGEVSFQADQGRITRIVFLTDVSLRGYPMTGNIDITSPKWRLEVAKGSIVDWPK